MDLCHLRRGGLLARGGPVVAHRRADRDHPHGLAPHILEVAASACALDARPAGPPRADRRPDWPSARVAAARPRRGAVDLADSASSLRLLEPAAVWPQGDAPGGLATMELPLLACTTGMLYLFWSFLDTGRLRWFWASAGMAGLAFSCKFTTVLFPPILAVIWWLDGWRRGGRGSLFRVTRQVTLGMAVYVLVLLLADFAITGFAVLPPSRSTGDHPTIKAKFGGELAGWIARLYETPVPQDWVGLATQAHHQMSGGSSYLLGERRMTGWRYYYFVALAVKVPLTFWLLLAACAALVWRRDRPGQPRDELLPLTIGLFL